MDKQKIDHLFKKKLHDLEVTPSVGAWKMVEKQLKPQHRYKVYWIAASLSAVIAVWGLLSPTKEVPRPLAYHIDYPRLASQPDWHVPETERAVAREGTTYGKEQKTLPLPRPAEGVYVAQKESKTAPVRKISTKTPSVDEPATGSGSERTATGPGNETDSLFKESTAIAVIKEETTTQPRILKITYKAGSPEPVPANLSGTLKKVLAFAGKISPGKMIADFKTAKDGLFNARLKKKNKDKHSL